MCASAKKGRTVTVPIRSRASATVDPNNRPGGPNLILTSKSANKVQFFNAGTLAKTAELDMPASTHEMIRSPDGEKIYASIYGGGIFGKNKDPDRRIAVIDLPSKKLERTIDLGANIAPHSMMMDTRGTLWSTAELGNAVLAIDPATGKVERIDVGGSPHWIAISHAANKLFASFKTKEAVAVIDLDRRAAVATIDIPHGAEGLAATPDGETLLVCAHRKGVLHEIDARSNKYRRAVLIEGAPGEDNQLRRVRVSPDGAYVCVSSHVDDFAAIYEGDTLEQIGGFDTRKAPMGFGFAADGKHAYLCCHDAAITLEFELATGRITRQFSTAAGCEFVISF
jgi:DNA-binding beta-propeller fold protein YncE